MEEKQQYMTFIQKELEDRLNALLEMEGTPI